VKSGSAARALSLWLFENAAMLKQLNGMMKSTSPNRKRLFALVNQFSFVAPPIGVQDFPLRAAVKRKPGLVCQINQGPIGGGGALDSES